MEKGWGNVPDVFGDDENKEVKGVCGIGDQNVNSKFTISEHDVHNSCDNMSIRNEFSSDKKLSYAFVVDTNENKIDTTLFMCLLK